MKLQLKVYTVFDADPNDWVDSDGKPWPVEKIISEYEHMFLNEPEFINAFLNKGNLSVDVVCNDNDESLNEKDS